MYVHLNEINKTLSMIFWTLELEMQFILEH